MGAPGRAIAVSVALGLCAVALAAGGSGRRIEKPLPAFSGWTLEGGKLEISSLIGKRLILVFFNPEVREAAPLVDGVVSISGLRREQNFEIVGIAVASNPRRAKAFTSQHRVDFPVIDDSSAAIARRFGMRGPAGVIGADAEGFVTFGFGMWEEATARAVESQLRTALRLPELDLGAAPQLGSRPPAPAVRGRTLDGGTFDLAAHRGEPVVLIFFLHTCPHCHEALRFLKKTLPEIAGDRRPTLVGVEITGRTYSVRRVLEEKGFDFFPVLFDDDRSIQSAYGVFSGVPDIVLIDDQGGIAARMQGWEDRRHAPLLRMRLAKLSGAPVPMLLRAEGYSGSEACGVCHQSEHETWLLTNHASAFDTLVRHGASHRDDCVGCHVVGWEQRGGFASSLETPDLEDVGCEACHGRGGPHLSPGLVSDGNYASACSGCHDTKHSLGFEYATFLPRVSHAANADLASLSLDEKRKRLAERGRPRENLLPTSAAVVGSDACRDCHAAEYATWSASPHARAVKTLAAAEQAGNAECLRCHTTAFGRPGGFPADGGAESHPDLARVGCESCHGPGGNHVGEGAPRVGTIVSLGDKCDSCVILQICGGCHDEANDPGFEFDVQDKIEKQRHGTIEPGTGRPLDRSAGLDAGSVGAAVGRAFDLVGAAGGR